MIKYRPKHSHLFYFVFSLFCLGFVDWYLDTRPDTLQEARVPLHTNRDCKNAYGTRVKAKMVCAGAQPPEERADTCKGDSGGPMVCQSGETGPYKLWGITSWGENTVCDPNPTIWRPGVYTRVERYLRWIQRKLRSRKCWWDAWLGQWTSRRWCWNPREITSKVEILDGFDQVWSELFSPKGNLSS